MEDVSILAKGESRRFCNFDTEEIWGVKDIFTYPDIKGKRIDKIFDFEPRAPAYLGILNGTPLVSRHDYGTIKYPFQEIVEKFNTIYFTNTITYMLAYAFYLGIPVVKLYGADAPFSYPYFLEKPGIEYWMGRAPALGIKVLPSEGSHLLRTKDGLPYGEENTGLMRLYLSERLTLLNLLPQIGHYEDVYTSNTIQDTLSVKVDEALEYNVELHRTIGGDIDYKAKTDFTKDIWLPDWAWGKIRQILTRLEFEGKLPAKAQSVFDKVVINGNENWEMPNRRPSKVVSYILTTKNRHEFLPQTFENIKKWLTPRDELIVIDGNSIDGSKDIIQEYSGMITKIVSEDDLSGAHALNKGILLAEGEFVKQLPDDDVIFPDGMEHAISYMQYNPEIDLLVCGGIKQVGDTKILVTAPADYGHDVSDVFKYGACGTGFVYRRSSFAKIGLLDTKHLIADQEFALRTIKNGKVAFLPVNLYLHPLYLHSTMFGDQQELKKHRESLIKEYAPDLMN